MKLMVCDRCGKQAPEHHTGFAIKPVYVRFRLDAEDELENIGDFCRKCRENLDQLIEKWIKDTKGRG